MKEAAENVQEKVGDMVDSARDKATEAGQKTANLPKDVKEVKADKLDTATGAIGH
eukprot:CAMPEP_0185830068 /NCGR_PEP_ID=MMETSP1353-20130828/612_1 /TAXON_ID=1077150 /ORGANISM="Erythrolobus australicus, Strain CCMP3124" /LENGTH=54 /DNA_ID=CAMNT_0028527925 /DNA_START=70 /DNA_END=234 /DNA_ORIENTATION=+